MSKLSVEGIKSMSKQTAQKFVQEKLAQVKEILDECEQVMDIHRFVADLPTSPTWYQLTYLPRNLTPEEMGSVYAMGEHLHWAGINENHKEGGVWVTSSEFGDCD